MSLARCTLLLLLPLLVTALFAACGSGGDEPRITVAAAADLQYAFEELDAPFEEQCGCDLVLTFGSSGNFSTQIEEGLPVDVFASANISYVDKLEAKGLVVADTKEVYAVGRIVLAVPKASSLEPTALDLVTDPAVRHLSIANPEHAPYGVAAQEALESVGLWDAVEAKLVLGENAAQATQFVETGDAEAGIIPLSLAVQRVGSLRYLLIDDSLHNPLRQAAAVVSSTDHQELAASFIEFINSAATVWRFIALRQPILFSSGA
jgi:molybdate transport system substrate-binding protein